MQENRNPDMTEKSDGKQLKNKKITLQKLQR